MHKRMVVKLAILCISTPGLSHRYLLSILLNESEFEGKSQLASKLELLNGVKKF